MPCESEREGAQRRPLSSWFLRLPLHGRSGACARQFGLTVRKPGLLLIALSVLALAGAGVRAPSRAAAAPAAAPPCGLPAAIPSWFDLGGVDFWGPLAQGPITIATSYAPNARPQFPPTIPHDVYFDLHLRNRVGTPSAPADPATIVARANKLFDYAVGSTACTAPYIALNELFGASTPWPWTPTTERYRSNVLVFLRTLAAPGRAAVPARQ